MAEDLNKSEASKASSKRVQGPTRTPSERYEERAGETSTATMHKLASELGRLAARSMMGRRRASGSMELLYALGVGALIVLSLWFLLR